MIGRIRSILPHGVALAVSAPVPGWSGESNPDRFSFFAGPWMALIILLVISLLAVIGWQQRHRKRRRRFPRRGVFWTTEWRGIGGKNGEATVADASASGAFLRAEGGLTQIQPGAALHIRIDLPGLGPGPLELFCTVRWSGFSRTHQCHGLGVEFSHINATIGEYAAPSA